MYDEIVYICGDDPAREYTANEYIKENNEEALIAKEDNEEDLTPNENNEEDVVPKEDEEGGNETVVCNDVNILMDDDDVQIDDVREEAPATLRPPPSYRSQQVSTSSASSGRTGESGKERKSRHLGDRIDFLASQIGELAAAIRSHCMGISSELYSEVMKCEGYDEASLGKAFDYLNENENLAKGFIVKSSNLRQVWLAEFFSGSQVI